MATDTTVEVWFGVDPWTYPGGGDTPTDLTSLAFSLSTARGRISELDETRAGRCVIQLRNHNGDLLPAELFDEVLRDDSDVALTDDSDVEITMDRAFTDAANIVEGLRIRVTVTDAAADEEVFVGFIEEWAYSFDVEGRMEATIIATDELAILAGKSSSAEFAQPSEKAGAFLASWLTSSTIDYTGSTTGLSTSQQSSLAATTVPAGTNGLRHAQLIARSDNGRLFASRQGALTYEGKYHSALASVEAAFSNTGSDIRFTGISVERSSEKLFGRVDVTRSGGTLVSASGPVRHERTP